MDGGVFRSRCVRVQFFIKKNTSRGNVCVYFHCALYEMLNFLFSRRQHKTFVIETLKALHVLRIYESFMCFKIMNYGYVNVKNIEFKSIRYSEKIFRMNIITILKSGLGPETLSGPLFSPIFL